MNGIYAPSDVAHVIQFPHYRTPRLRTYLFASVLVVVGCGGGGGGSGGNVSFTPIPNASVSGCFQEDYPEPATSEYTLPYAVGTSFLVNQGNCGKFSTHRPDCDAGGVSCGDERFAYDFSMPIGTMILAARAGEVLAVADGFPNTSSIVSETNLITVLHADGTVASYVHLSPIALVSVGDLITSGDPIGISGESGFTGVANPHLHFHVDKPPFNDCSQDSIAGCVSTPVTFRNASPLDVPLVEGSTYEAVPL